MTKTYLTFTLFLFFVISGIISCQKNKETGTVAPIAITKETLAGSYKLTAATTGGISVYNNLEDCQKDDISKLNADFTAAYIDAGIKCNPPGDDVGTWNLVSSKKIVIIGQEADIVSYDGKTLVVSGMDNSTGFNLLVTLTYTKQ